MFCSSGDRILEDLVGVGPENKGVVLDREHGKIRRKVGDGTGLFLHFALMAKAPLVRVYDFQPFAGPGT